MLTVKLTYDPLTRLLSSDGEWIGTNDDNLSSQITVDGIDALLVDYTAELVFGVTAYRNNVIFHPIGLIDAVSKSHIIPASIIACAIDGILPVQLRLTKGSQTIVSLNTVNLNVSHAIESVTVYDAYRPEVLGKTSEWMADVQYAKGSLVLRNEILYYSIVNNNFGNDPLDGVLTLWRLVSVVAVYEFSEMLGDGIETVFVVEHNLMSYEVAFTIDANGTDLSTSADVEVLDGNRIKLTFLTPPPIGTVIHVDESYIAITHDRTINGDLIVKGYSYFASVETQDLTVRSSLVKMANGNIEMDSNGVVRAGKDTEELPIVTRSETMATDGIVAWDGSKGVTRSLKTSDVPSSVEMKENKVSAFSPIPLDKNYPSEKLVKEALDEKAKGTDLTDHTTDGTIHVTSGNKLDWNHVSDEAIRKISQILTDDEKAQARLNIGTVDKVEVDNHISDGDIHVIKIQKDAWNAHIIDTAPHVTADDKTRLGNTVLSTVQTLTSGQKTQARANIDAMGLSGNESINGNKDFRGYTTGIYVNPQYRVIKDRFPTNESMLEMSTGVIRNGEFNSDLVITNYGLVNYIVGDGAFRGCSNLRLFNFSKTKIVMTLAFYDCPELKIHVNFTGFKLHGRAFEKCGIKSIDCTMNFPIEDRTFDQCANLLMVVLRDGMYELKNISAFTSTPIANGTGYIYVPDALYDAYLIATNWVLLAPQIKRMSELP